MPDTAADWEWWLDCWDYVLDAAQLTASDRVLLAFSFGPFIGFWSAHDALARRGAMILPGGGLDTAARLQMANDAGATALFCTPTYALRMAEVAAELGVDLASTDVRRLVVAGEPGGSIPAHRAAVESAWGAEVLDHSGATEVGAWGYGAKTGSGLHVIESEFVAETLAVETGQPAAEGELAELVLTSLGRLGCPVLRYRTGDLVRAQRPTEGDDRFLLLEGGVLGRADDMLVIRGVNVFPSSVEAILRSFPEVAEFRLTARRVGQLDQLLLEVEDRADATSRLATALRTGLGFNVQVEAVPLGSLPRFEAKAQRFIDERT